MNKLFSWVTVVVLAAMFVGVIVLRTQGVLDDRAANWIMLALILVALATGIIRAVTARRHSFSRSAGQSNS